MKGYIHSIETFGTVDGPGIRYVVFMQGCPLRCKYCHNPDTWQMNTGQQMEVEEVLKGFYNNQSFYKDGGVTVTGGEPLMQIEFVTELFKHLKQHQVHTALDTSGITFSEKTKEKFDELIKYTDLVLLDIKHIDPKGHVELTQQKLDSVLAFARYLSDHQIPVWIRHVVVYDITYKEEYLYQLGLFLGTLNNVKAIDVLPYHTMGIVKYQQMNLEYPLKDTKETSKDDALQARNIVLKGYRESRRNRI